MGFRQADSEGRGGFARIWSVEDKGNYSVAKISTRKKNRDGEGYETDFQDGFVRLIGSAHTKAQTLNVGEKGVAIQITSCEVTTPYNHDTNKSYTNYAIFAFEVSDGDGGYAKGGKKTATKTAKSTKAKAAPVEDDEEDNDLPF